MGGARLITPKPSALSLVLSQVEWREYSFFQNPRMSEAVNSSRLVVETCAAGASDCSDGSAAAAVQVCRLTAQE